MNNNYNGYNNFNNYNNNNYNQMPNNDNYNQMPNTNPNNNQNPGMPSNTPNTMNGNFYDFSSDLNTSNGYSNENASFTSSKKHHFPFFGFLEFLIIVFLCVYIANDKGYLNIPQLDNLIPEKEVKEETTTTEETPEVKEENITDSTTISELTKRVYYLSNVGVDFNNLISPIYSKTTKSSDLTEKQKLQSILLGKLTIESGYTSLMDLTEFNTVFPNLASNQSLISNIRYIDASSISSTYLKIYGATLAATSTDSTCPEFVYNASYNRYYLNANCTASEHINTTSQYVYKATSKEDKYYIYTSVAFIKENEDSSSIVYKDYKLTDTYKTYATEADLKAFSVDKTNYQDFSKYKITFTKKDNNYIFEQIESVTE